MSDLVGNPDKPVFSHRGSDEIWRGSTEVNLEIGYVRFEKFARDRLHFQSFVCLVSMATTK